MAKTSVPRRFASRTADKFVVRLPEGLRDDMRAAAAANSRSTNAEIVNRLLESLHDDSNSWTPVVGMLVNTPQGVGVLRNILVTEEDEIVASVAVGADAWTYLCPLNQISPFKVSRT
jgi:hypothetical protein